MHTELAAVPDSLYHVTRANRVIAGVMQDGVADAGTSLETDCRSNINNCCHRFRMLR
jgi:hypothetical protein